MRELNEIELNLVSGSGCDAQSDERVAYQIGVALMTYALTGNAYFSYLAAQAACE